ncbi:MAG: glycerol-3-phosphate 1-O-acyltransferase PlsY [Firmicutes bacterium]|nr:glycerol-3-phosphate 1-O-acyltransferase PlsY [Bacillota bacterium]
MEIFIKIGVLFLGLLIGYLCGSIPNAVIIGKVFFKKDIREFGSHNAGGTNAGRVLGKKAGVVVMILDVIKTSLPIWGVFALVSFTVLGVYAWSPWTYYLTGIGAMVGHCFPIFAHFRGGKAVSSFGGFVLATNWVLALIGIAIMLIVLKIKKHVSLGSIVSSGLVTALSLVLFLPALAQIGMWTGMESGPIYTAFLIVETFYLYDRHHENIKRLLDHQERRITWMS